MHAKKIVKESKNLVRIYDHFPHNLLKRIYIQYQKAAAKNHVQPSRSFSHH